MRFNRKKTFEEPLLKRNGDIIYIKDCPFEVMKETKHNVILYNGKNNNLIITDNYDQTIGDVTAIFVDIRFSTLYYKITNSRNLVIVVRSDEGLTNDYHVFEEIDIPSIISNKVSFKSVFEALSEKESYFLG